MSMRLWRAPRVHPVHQQGNVGAERKTPWLALFYDLVFVAAIVQLGTILSGNVSLLGFLEFVALFFPIWWAWNGLTFYMNRFEVDDIWHRLMVFVQMFALVNMAFVAGQAFGPSSLIFAVAFTIVRLVLVVQHLRAWAHNRDTESRTAIRHFITGFGIATIFWIISIAVPPPHRYFVWAAGAAVDLVLPFTAGRHWLRTLVPADLEHLAERFGEFTLIALGESFLKVIINLSGATITPFSIMIGIFTFAIICSLWWTYFDDVAGAEVQLQNKPGRSINIWQYGHFLLMLGIVATGVSVEKVMDFAFHGEFASYYRWLFCSAVAITLTAVAVLDLVTERKDSVANSWQRAGARLVAAVFVIALAPAGNGVSTTLLIGLVTLACCAQVGFDLRAEAQAVRKQSGRDRLATTD